MKWQICTTLLLFLISAIIPVSGQTVKPDSGLSLENIGTLTAGIAAAVGLPISLISIYFGKRKQKMESLIEFFKILNDNDHREARQKMYSAFHEYERGVMNAFSGKDIRTHIAMVRADMDQLGTLYHHNLIPKKVFLEAYWNTILLCWKALRDDIEEERIRRGYPTYMKYFEELKDECSVYWKNHHPEVKHIRVYSE